MLNADCYRTMLRALYVEFIRSPCERGHHVTGKARLSEDNIKDTLREVRMALLEADVALPVVKDFVNSVRDRAVAFGLAQ